MESKNANSQINDLITSLYTSDAYYKEVSGRHIFNQFPIAGCKRLEPRTRKENSDTALSFGVHDPLWMLTRQWQFGEFKGDDCGSAILAKIKVEKTEFTDLVFNPKDSGKVTKMPFDRQQAMEYLVERMNVAITPAIRVDSACYFRKMLDYSELKPLAAKIDKFLLEKFPLTDPFDDVVDLSDKESTADECLSTIKIQSNERLEQFMSSYRNRIFDGAALYLALTGNKVLIGRLLLVANEQSAALQALLDEYAVWFAAHYLPADNTTNCWVDEQLGYDFALTVPDKSNREQTYSLQDYSTGNLSWYSFDWDKKKNVQLMQSSKIKKSTQLHTFIPTLAEFPDAPNKRLWKFEDARVSMGNSEMGAAALANAVILQFTTMYGNDWLLTPMDIEIGTVSEVKGIIVTDVFGEYHYIDRPVGAETTMATSYGSKWEMYTISNHNAYQDRDFATDGRLFFPPSQAHNEESKPVEEVQFLRDEMANMLWGVEARISDGCGRSMDGTEYASKVVTMVDELNPVMEGTTSFTEGMVEADYSYLLQNRVPLNWIPFLPVKFKPHEEHAIREIRLQRAAMPLFVKDAFRPVRPCTQLLRTGINENDKVEAHRFINEEEITGVGTKLILTHQQTRWLNGKTYNWLGAKKQISKSQANSGLQFDELIEKVKKSARKVR